MNAKTPRSAPAPKTATTRPEPFNFFTDLSRQQLVLATESACALFRGSQAVRKIQQQAAHQALLQYESTAEKLRASGEPAQLLAIESALLRINLQEASQYWQQLAATALQTQVEMLGCASHLLDAGPQSGLKPVLENWQAALVAPASQLPAALKPVLDSWQAVLASSMNGAGSSTAAH